LHLKFVVKIVLQSALQRFCLGSRSGKESFRICCVCVCVFTQKSSTSKLENKQWKSI
jgi:hypothetical protein